MASGSDLVGGPARAELPGRRAGGERTRPRPLRLLFAAKIAISGVLLAWILSEADLSKIFEALGAAHGPLLLLALVLNFVGAFVSVTRWRVLLRSQTINIRWGFLLSAHLVAVFFNNFLPSTVGGDVSRAYDCYRASGNTRAVSTVLVDRLLGLFVLVLLALGSLLFVRPLSERLPELPLWLIGCGIGLVSVLAGIFVRGPSILASRHVFERLPVALERPTLRVLSAFEQYQGQWIPLARALALSLLLQLNAIAHFAVISLALGLNVPVSDFLLIVPLVLFVTMLPISINGIGLRENVLAGILGIYGVTTSNAVALAWLDYLIGLSGALVGGLIYALRR